MFSIFSMDKATIDFWGRIYIIILPVKRHKNIQFYCMEKYFENLLVGFEQAKSDAVKSTIYDAMVEYANSCHDGYACYDMDMYVALYKCANTSKQRKQALEHIYSIISDDAFQYHDELIQNLKEFTQMKEFLNEDDVEEFDAICMEALDFFEKQKKESEFETFAGQADFIPEVPLWKAYEELKEVAEIIVGTDMRGLESYQNAKQILGQWIISRGLSTVFL